MSAADAPLSSLILHPNRHVTLVLDDGVEIPMRPPTVDEWRQVLEFFVTAETVLMAEQGDEHPTPVASTLRLATEAPYAVALASTVTLLSRTQIDAGSLPMWAQEVGTFPTLHEHWRHVEVIFEEADPAPVAAAPLPAPWSEVADGEIPVFDLNAARQVDAQAPTPAPAQRPAPPVATAIGPDGKYLPAGAH